MSNSIKHFLFILCAASLITSCKDKPEHGVEVSPQTVDLGIVYTDSATRTVDIAYTNTGKQPIVIEDIQPDCDCTTTKFAPSYLRSGDSGNMTVTVDLHRLNPQRFEKHVAMMFDGIKEPVIVKIKGEVKRK